jgi:hypothetical protein
MPIKAIPKPIGTWCQHALPGKGCAIHADPSRPEVCGAFHCAWILYPDAPDALRPDRSKVVLTTSPGSGGTVLTAYCDPDFPDAWRRPLMYRFLKDYSRPKGGRPPMVLVWVAWRLWLITPDADHDLGEVNGRKSFRIEPGPDGKPVARLVDHILRDVTPPPLPKRKPRRAPGLSI